MKALQIKDIILESLEDIKAINPIALNVQSISTLTDYMIIASGTSNRHAQSMGEKVVSGLKDKKIKGLRTEGMAGDDWFLVDAGEVVVHLMSHEARDFYDLESLWDSDL